MSMPVIDENKKGGFFRSKVSDKPTETTLEKFGKDTKNRPSSSSNFFSSGSKKAYPHTFPALSLSLSLSPNPGGFHSFNRPTSAPKQEEVKFDKKKSKTGHVESFGVDLAEQVAREGGTVPKVVLACTAAVEKRGIDRVGIYRLSAAQSKLQSLQSEIMHGNE